MKKIMALLLAAMMAFALAACSNNTAGGNESQVITGTEAIDVIGEDGIDWNHMSSDELYEMAKAEGGTITIYSATSDVDKVRKLMRAKYPDLNIEYISCDTDTILQKIELEAESGSPMADVVVVKDASGEIYNELVLWDLVKIYYPADICSHIKDDMLRFGLPLYSTFNPWFYNTRKFDTVPLESWWDIVRGYNVDTHSYKDSAGNNTQYWTIFTKDITAPSYAALWAQLITDSDALKAQYESQYGEPLVFTYQDHLKNETGVMEFPENNAGVELFWRFSQMTITPLSDGDAVVKAVNDEDNVLGPTLGLCSASKLDNSKLSVGEEGMDIAWVTGLSPYTAQDAATYSYVVTGCDNPAGARLFIRYMMGDVDGKSGAYNVFDKLGHWSVRDDFSYEESGITYDEVNLKAPDFAQIYANYPNVKAYWTYWNSTR